MGHVTTMRRIGWAALALAFVVCIALPLIHAPWVSSKGGPQSIIGEEGLFEQFQWPWYFVSMALMIWAARREPALPRGAEGPGYRGFFILAAAGFFLLGWREADPDTLLFRERWYNAPGKLFEDELTWGVRLTLLALFCVFAGVIGYLGVRYHRNVGRWLADHRWRYPAVLGAIAVALLALGVMTDKYKTVNRHLGIDLDFQYNAYFEECVELLGPIVLMITAIEVIAAPLRPAPPPAQPTD